MENKTPQQQTEDTKKLLRNQIELAKLQKELSGYNADIAENNAREAFSYAKMAQFTKHANDAVAPEQVEGARQSDDNTEKPQPTAAG